MALPRRPFVEEVTNDEVDMYFEAVEDSTGFLYETIDRLLSQEDEKVTAEMKLKIAKDAETNTLDLQKKLQLLQRHLANHPSN